MTLRRLLAVLAVPVLAAGLTACGPEDGEVDASPTVQEETGAEETGTEEPADEESAGGESADQDSADETTEEDPTTGEPTDEEPADETTAAEPEETPTAVETLWIDDSWTVEPVQEDLCEMGGYASQYTEQEDLFVCGPTAAGAEACALEDGTVQCIVDPVGKQAIEFDSPTASAQVEPSQSEAIPLLVTLPDGATCATISHDHDQHFEGMFSWYRCDDGSELLTPEAIADTFTRGGTWTVQRSVDQGEPVETPVATAVFAGR